MRRVVWWGLPVLSVLMVIGYLGISYLIAAQVAESEHNEQDEFPEDYGLEYKDVEFTSREDGLMLRGWYVHGGGEGPTLIFVHGIGSVRSGDNAVELASMLVGRGFDVLMFDLRGHGSSEGDRVSGGDHERQDVLGALDFLEGRGVLLEDVGVLGFSMGAGTAVLAMAEEPEVRALVLDSAYANASDRIAHEIEVRTVFPEWIAPIFVPGAKLAARLIFDIDIGALVPEKVVAELNYPVLIIHGDADTRIPFEHGIRVHAASHADSELWLVKGVDHVDAFLTYPEEYTERVASYFDDRLGGE